MAHPTQVAWGPFLHDRSGEWADSATDDVPYDRADEAARQDRWPGFPAAPEERIAALEARLGRRMPPSYQEFLAVSDRWRHAGGFITLLAGTAEVRRHDDGRGTGHPDGAGAMPTGFEPADETGQVRPCLIESPRGGPPPRRSPWTARPRHRTLRDHVIPVRRS